MANRLTTRPRQRFLDHLARIDRCLAHRAPEQLDVFGQAVLRIEHHRLLVGRRDQVSVARPGSTQGSSMLSRTQNAGESVPR
jgi:hypothetical protein